MSYKYYSTQRPLSLGAIPRKPNFVVTNFSDRILSKEIGREAWGFVEYETPLTPQEIQDYELTPAPHQTEINGSDEK